MVVLLKFNVNTNVVKTASLAGLTISSIKNYSPINIVRVNETINKAVLWSADLANNWDYVAIYKGTPDGSVSFSSWTELLRLNITMANNQPLEIPSGSFTNLSLTKDEIVYAFASSTSTNNVGTILIDLHTT